MQAKRTTIKDIAKVAGVSLGSVHLAMTGKPGLGDDTRVRILEIAEKLNYQQNAAAASLKRKMLRIGAILPALDKQTSLFYRAMWQGVRDTCEASSDFNVELVEIDYYDSVVVMPDTLQQAFDQKLDGIVMLGAISSKSIAALAAQTEAGLPVVLVGSDQVRSGRLCCVKADNVVIGKIIGEIFRRTLRQDGAILVCAGDEGTPANAETVLGIEAYFAENNIRRDLIKLYYKSDLEPLREALHQHLNADEPIAGCCSVTARGSVCLSDALVKCNKAGILPSIGSDIFAENLVSLRDNIFMNLIQKRPYEQAQLGVQILLDYLVRNQHPTQDTYFVGCEAVFQSALSLYEADSFRMRF